MTDIDLTEEQIRQMEAKLLAGPPRRDILVETRRSGKKPTEMAVIRVIEVSDKSDRIAFANPYEWIFEQRQAKGWVEFERFGSSYAAKQAARKYQADGAEVQWWTRRK